MPTKRQRRGHNQREIGAGEQEHLDLGAPADERGHLLESEGGVRGCWICERGGDSARQAWAANRIWLITAWHKRGFWFPSFAQCVFDGAKMPDPKPEWNPGADFINKSTAQREYEAVVAAVTVHRAKNVR